MRGKTVYLVLFDQESVLECKVQSDGEVIMEPVRKRSAWAGNGKLYVEKFNDERVVMVARIGEKEILVASEGLFDSKSKLFLCKERELANIVLSAYKKGVAHFDHIRCSHSEVSPDNVFREWFETAPSYAVLLGRVFQKGLKDAIEKFSSTIIRKCSYTFCKFFDSNIPSEEDCEGKGKGEK